MIDQGRREAARVFAFIALAYAIRQLMIDAPGLMRGAVYWIGLGVFAIAMILAARHALIWLSDQRARPRRWESLLNASLVTASLTMCCVGIEIYLDVMADAEPMSAVASERIVVTGNARVVLTRETAARMHRTQATRIHNPDWDGQRIDVPGVTMAFRWHGVPHIQDRDGFRRPDGAFPPKAPETARIMVLGDSQTFGYGVAAPFAYPQQLQDILARDHAMEVLNLGVVGYQSEDIARVLERFAAPLRPDLILYGICLNDFLPTGKLERDFDLPAIPLPLWIGGVAAVRTRLGRMIKDAYQPLLIMIGLRNDFYEEVLRGIGTYGPRFAADLRRMNAHARAIGAGPIIGMVLDPHPRRDGKGQKLARIAEAAMRDAGFENISTEAFYALHDGISFGISRWDGHPNEEAHAIFASMIADHLARRGDLRKYLRPAPG